MKEDDLDLTDREKEAIEAIGRELDREFGGADPDADAGRDGGVENLAPAVSPKPHAVAALHVALAVGTGTLSVVLALTTLIAPSGLAPATHEPSPGNLAPFGARAPTPPARRAPSRPTRRARTFARHDQARASNYGGRDGDAGC